MRLPNLIIAGSPKTGTTSIFRYLADHPDVCPSSIKEIHFFYRFEKKIDAEALQHYGSYFSRSESRHSVRLEASPRYLIGGRPIAELLRRYLQDVKLIFILREPVSRFISRFVSLHSKTNLLASHSDIDKLVDLSLAHPQALPDPEKPECGEEILKYLWEGCYSRFLKEYFRIFSKRNICILSFDELSQSPRRLVTRLCRFACIDPTFHRDYQFSVENRTRIVKYRRLHKFAERFNRSLEYFLNKYPVIRRRIRSIYYNRINPQVGTKDSVVTSYAIERLSNYYSPLNQELQSLLKTEFPDLTLPKWIQDTSQIS